MFSFVDLSIKEIHYYLVKHLTPEKYFQYILHILYN